MSVAIRGGFPVTVQGTSLAAPVEAQARFIAPAWTMHLRITNTGGAPLRVYWTPEDFAANANYESIAAGAVWSEPAEVAEIWVLGATTFTATFFARRG